MTKPRSVKKQRHTPLNSLLFRIALASVNFISMKTRALEVDGTFEANRDFRGCIYYLILKFCSFTHPIPLASSFLV